MIYKFNEKCGVESCMCSVKEGIVHCRHCNDLIIKSKDAPENICYTCNEIQQKMNMRDVISYGIDIAVSNVLRQILNRYKNKLPNDLTLHIKSITESPFWTNSISHEIAGNVTEEILDSLIENETQSSVYAVSSKQSA